MKKTKDKDIVLSKTIICRQQCYRDECPFRNYTEFGTICNMGNYRSFTKDGNTVLKTIFKLKITLGRK